MLHQVVQVRVLEMEAMMKFLISAGSPGIAPCYLYFGCRGLEMDFYYRQQWEGYVQSRVLAADNGLVTAFSQDPPSKMYVTHRVRQHARQLYGLLTQVMLSHLPYWQFAC